VPSTETITAPILRDDNSATASATLAEGAMVMTPSSDFDFRI